MASKPQKKVVDTASAFSITRSPLGGLNLQIVDNRTLDNGDIETETLIYHLPNQSLSFVSSDVKVKVKEPEKA